MLRVHFSNVGYDRYIGTGNTRKLFHLSPMAYPHFKDKVFPPFSKGFTA